ncbi:MULTISPECIES: HNH endonuclease [unclassified Pseudomonas]|uniref:HNH endonuclease n=1 Tax=unclassified Pseudomonas TaxID=196821 RepID=UPI0021605C2B|nr:MULTISPECIES: HNH endonuclease [unclassified Pseudomonas]UVM52220.1 HNH endonuclease [Pseudomonas sp. B21-015]WPN60430.1 HNH endonuclease [Pseudomonas sp. P9_31]
MDRKPKIDVRRQLRKEVGFGCPILGCGSPFLEWHHFDPPWRELNHHNPEGMIALCVEHHAQADGGAFTVDQLKKLKKPKEGTGHVEGRFNWMRNELLMVVGGSYFVETYEAIRYQGNPLIWLSRDDEGYLLLNVAETTVDGEPRFSMEESFWTVHGNQEDVECPPSGKMLSVKYPNGDSCSVKFLELTSEEALRKQYAEAPEELFQIKTPLTAVEVTFRAKSIGLDIGPKRTIVGGNSMEGCFAIRCRTGVVIS